MAHNDTDPRDEAGLDAFFDAARATAPVPSAALLGRILADADAVTLAQAATPPRPTARGGVFAALAAMIGGWPALAGMATATVAGVWIGAAQPPGLSDVAGALLPVAQEYSLDDLSPSYDAMAGLEEGWAE